MAHEYSHAFAGIKDHAYGYYKCLTTITSAYAINNADSFGYYIQDLYATKGK